MEQTEAILIRKQAWSDTSLITTWLTSGHGKITAMARAARKPGSQFAGSLDLFHKAEIGYVMPKRGSLHTLREVRLLEVFAATSASNLFLCGYFAELIDLVTQPGEPFPEIYDLFSRATAHLSRSPASTRSGPSKASPPSTPLSSPPPSSIAIRASVPLPRASVNRSSREKTPPSSPR